MPRETLLDFFDDLGHARGDFVVYDDGYRARTFTYAEIAGAARAFSSRLQAAGFSRGDKVLIWSENRPGWIVGFWGCLLTGAIVVPIDDHTSPEFVRRIGTLVGGRLVLAGDEVPVSALNDPPGGGTPLSWWLLRELEHARKNAESRERGPGGGDRAPPSPVSAPDRSVGRDDVAEIIFTSGATAEPKGVLVTHRNLLANIIPVEREIMKYRAYARPFLPLRFLNLLPLSHLFGQALATFIPPMLPGTVIFMRGYDPAEIVRQIRSRKASVVVGVPKILEVLREYMEHLFPGCGRIPDRLAGAPKVIRIGWRWWRHRRIHRLLGWKFWSFVVGAAPLEPGLERFWARLGFLVVQGYGLTEAAPIVTINHPLNARSGSVGKPLPGVEVTIAPDGEILVRGENVAAGYFDASGISSGLFEDGWLRTGDIGELDAEGRLYVRGRKREMIVTPEGFNVFPDDIEPVLNSIPGVRESAVIGVRREGEERVHAVLVLETSGPGAAPIVHPAEIIRQANLRLSDHQKIQGATVWAWGELPRTEGLRKLKRGEIRARVESKEPAEGIRRPEDPIVSVLSKYLARVPAVAGGPSQPDLTLDQLGLSSLERVELLLALEDRFQTTIDEHAFSGARDLRDLQALVAGGIRNPEVESAPFPSWNRSLLARLTRRVFLSLLILPLTRLFAHLRVQGLENLQALHGPVIFASNHQSHLDTPAILAALPARWRYCLAPAMSKAYFDPHFFPSRYSKWEGWVNSLQYYLAVLYFCAFPLPQREAGVREALRHVGELAGAGFSTLMFPEGRRTDAGEINRFEPGVAMMAARLDLPVVPVRLEGLDQVLHRSWHMARPGRVRVTFGPPLRLTGEGYADLGEKVEEAVRNL
ncbi:MAG: AMP-binding protein [Acidobacteria bacterium]|nr:AMP-binding protein [Acidobacteriota bacterium]